MDRASDSGSEGWGFESLPVYQKDQIPSGIWSFCYIEEEGTRKIQSQYAGGILLQPVQKLVATLIFARPPQGQKCKRVPSGVPIKDGYFDKVAVLIVFALKQSKIGDFLTFWKIIGKRFAKYAPICAVRRIF